MLKSPLDCECIAKSVDFRSRVIGLKEFGELLNVCYTLYDVVDSLKVELKLPRYYRVEHLGTGTLRFSKTGSFRSTFRPKPDPKELKRRRLGAEQRSQSPEAKRRRTSIPNIQHDVSLALEPKVPSSLPSPTSSHPPPSFPKSPEHRKPSPAAQKPPPAARKLSVAPRKPAAPKAPPTLKTAPGRKLLILPFTNKQRFKDKVAELQTALTPSAMSVARSPTPVIAVSRLPVPAATTGSPVALALPPAEPVKKTSLKLKLKLGPT
jgi:transcription initiation factor TFIID subunit 2